MPVFWLVVAFFILAPCACFLVLAVSPRLFDQGSQWFTLDLPARTPSAAATAVALVNSIWVSCAAAALGPRARLPDRLGGRAARRSRGGGWSPAACGSCCCCPRGCPSLGWVRLVQVDGVMYRVGLDLPFVTHAILGPVRGGAAARACAASPSRSSRSPRRSAGLGQEFEDAARIHGASRFQAIRLVTPILAPAIWSALAIGFAESVSDFGVAATLAYKSNFTPRDLPALRGDQQLPAELPGRGGDGLAARRLGGAAARAPGAGAARPQLRGALGPHAARSCVAS